MRSAIAMRKFSRALSVTARSCRTGAGVSAHSITLPGENGRCPAALARGIGHGMEKFQPQPSSTTMKRNPRVARCTWATPLTRVAPLADRGAFRQGASLPATGSSPPKNRCWRATRAWAPWPRHQPGTAGHPGDGHCLAPDIPARIVMTLEVLPREAPRWGSEWPGTQGTQGSRMSIPANAGMGRRRSGDGTRPRHIAAAGGIAAGLHAGPLRIRQTTPGRPKPAPQPLTPGRIRRRGVLDFTPARPYHQQSAESRGGETGRRAGLKIECV